MRFGALTIEHHSQLQYAPGCAGMMREGTYAYGFEAMPELCTFTHVLIGEAACYPLQLDG